MATFEVFARAHARSLFGTAYLLCGDLDAAEDLVQDVLVAGLQQWDRVQQARSPVAYLRRTLVNRFVDSQRGPRGRVIVMAEVPDASSMPDISDVVVARDAVRVLLATMPARPRAVVVLKYLYDWPDAEIAKAIGSRVATVRSITRRAITSLRAATLTDDGLAGRQATIAGPDRSAHPEAQ